MDKLLIKIAIKLSSPLVKGVLQAVVPLLVFLRPFLISFKSICLTSSVVGYLPRSSRGWILEFLFQDLAKYSCKSEFILCSNLLSVALIFCRSEKCVILAMHQSLATELVELGFPDCSIVSWYTHSRITQRLSHRTLVKISKWLPMNSSEFNTLVMAGVPANKIDVFPIGYDDTMFNIDNDQNSDREIDILFACRYVASNNAHYHSRKNYDLIVSVAEYFLSVGYTVAILGSGWRERFKHSSSSLKIFELPHHESPSIYRNSKLLLGLSLFEGGPVSWLEAMASGCLTLSCPSGFPLDHINSESGSYLLSPRPSKEEVISIANQLLECYSCVGIRSMQDRRKKFLSLSTFKCLAGKLEDLVI